jgi:hypothetical protein
MCPFSTEGGTRRVHFVREGGEGGGGRTSARDSLAPPGPAAGLTAGGRPPAQTIKPFPPGHYWTSKDMKLHQYYNPKWFDVAHATQKLSLELIRDTFVKAIDKRLMTDVPPPAPPPALPLLQPLGFCKATLFCRAALRGRRRGRGARAHRGRGRGASGAVRRATLRRPRLLARRLVRRQDVQGERTPAPGHLLHRPRGLPRPQERPEGAASACTPARPAQPDAT